MRRLRAIVAATVLEVLSEPLTLLVTLTALALSALAPALHYHQFGDPTRMARDAGLSALLTGGCLTAAFGAVRTLRREVESGTAWAALAHPVGCDAFFLAKATGAALAYAVFALTVACGSFTVVRGAALGALAAEATGLVPRLWGVSLVLALAAVLVPLAVGALLNRFARRRFVLWANMLALAVSVAGVAYRLDGALLLRLAPVYALAAMPPLVLLAAGAAAAWRLRSNAAAAGAALALAAFVPALGNYGLSDALSDGGALSWGYVLAAGAALVPAVGGLLALGLGRKM